MDAYHQELISSVHEEINYHKNDVQMVRQEKESLEQVLSVKAIEVRKTLTAEALRVEEDLKKSLGLQRVENIKLLQQIANIKNDKTTL